MRSRYEANLRQVISRDALRRHLVRWQRKLSFSILRVKAKLGCSAPTTKGPVFIVGTGRSGTHFLCSALNSISGLSDYYGGVESPHMFECISNKSFRGESLDLSQIEYYRVLMSLVGPDLLVDQTHPNLWHVDQLISSFPNAKFIAISRNIYSVINSMLSHEGTSSWIDAQRDFSPNEFLGITKQNLDLYKNNLSRLQRFAFRWIAHQRRIDHICKKYSANVLNVKYEDLGEDYLHTLKQICDFLEISFTYVRLPSFKKHSLNKQDLLSDVDRLQIQQALSLFDANS